MLKNHASDFYTFGSVLKGVHAEVFFYPPQSEQKVDEVWIDHVKRLCETVRLYGGRVGLNLSVVAANRLELELSKEPSRDFLKSAISELERRIEDELDSVLFLHVPSSKSEYYTGSELFGADVAQQFPSAIFDIEEAGKCFALGRYTACVFHLMRVMEMGVKFIGKKMQVTFTDDKTWDAILRDLNTKIKSLTNAGPGKLIGRKKVRRDKYAAAIAHLTNVKDAWRNRVMHPKDSYTDEQAEEVFRFVKAYMNYLSREL